MNSIIIENNYPVEFSKTHTNSKPSKKKNYLQGRNINSSPVSLLKFKNPNTSMLKGGMKDN